MTPTTFSLPPAERGVPHQVGDTILLHVFLGEKIGAPDDRWQADCPPESNWAAAESVTYRCSEVRALPADGDATKVPLEVLLHQPGQSIKVGGIKLRHLPSGREVLVAPQDLNLEVTALAIEEGAKPLWLQPVAPMGGWNWALVVLVVFVLAALVALAGRLALRRLRGRLVRKLNHREVALKALAALQKFSRNKQVMQQEEWKKFSFDLAGVLRKYCDQNFDIDSSDQTDRELLAELGRQTRAKNFVAPLAQILSVIDEVRYGKKALDATVVPGLLLESRKFVENTYQPKEAT